jgi:hypothetical protein
MQNCVVCARKIFVQHNGVRLHISVKVDRSTDLLNMYEEKRTLNWSTGIFQLHNCDSTCLHMYLLMIRSITIEIYFYLIS